MENTNNLEFLYFSEGICRYVIYTLPRIVTVRAHSLEKRLEIVPDAVFRLHSDVSLGTGIG